MSLRGIQMMPSSIWWVFLYIVGISYAKPVVESKQLIKKTLDAFATLAKISRIGGLTNTWISEHVTCLSTTHFTCVGRLPDLDIMVPSSARHSAPTRHITPHRVQIIRLKPTDPDSTSTPLGDTKIPEPTIVPIIRVQPLEKKCRKKKSE